MHVLLKVMANSAFTIFLRVFSLFLKRVLFSLSSMQSWDYRLIFGIGTTDGRLLLPIPIIRYFEETTEYRYRSHAWQSIGIGRLKKRARDFFVKT